MTSLQEMSPFCAVLRAARAIHRRCAKTVFSHGRVEQFFEGKKEGAGGAGEMMLYLMPNDAS